MTISPLVKYRSVCKINGNTGKKEGDPVKKYQVGMVLRENGRIEFYSDFILVNEYYNPNLQCVDIATDLNEFFLKFVKQAKKVTREKTNLSDLTYEIRHVPHFWRTRLGFNTTKLLKSQNWGSTIHKRISNYFRLYSEVLHFSRYMLVSHRNMISVFDMARNLDGDDGDHHKL